MGIQNISILIISSLTILLGFLVLRKKYKNPGNTWYFLMCLFGGGWGVMKAIELSSTSVYWHDFVFKFVMFFGIMAPLAYFMLAYNFIYKVKNLPKILLYFISSVTIVLAILSFAGVLKYVDAAIIDGVLYRNIIFWDY